MAQRVIACSTPAPRLPTGLRLLLALLGLWALLAHATHPAGAFTRGGLPHGDGLYHYAQVRSLVLDRDLRLGNDYAIVGNPHRQPVRDDGWAGNHFTIGTAITWVPTFVVGHAVSSAATALGWSDDPTDGSSARTQWITMLGSVLAGWLSLWLMARMLLRWLGPRAVGLAVLLAAVATPLWWYTTRQPSWSHAASALAVAGVCHATASGGPSRGLGRGVIVGLWLGLAALVRPQELVFAIWPVTEGLVALRERSRRRAALLGLGALVLTAGACWLPQAWVWQQTYGSAWQVPQGPEFMRWGDSQWPLVLWSSRGGLLAWSPAVGLAIVGVVMAAAGRGPIRGPARALAISLVLDVFVCGAVDDWWGGWAFGARRLVGATVVFALGWAVLLHPVLDRGSAGAWGGRRGGTAARVLVVVLALASIRLSLQLQRDYLSGRLQRGVPQSLAPAYSRAFGVPLQAPLERLGTPGSWPASWVFAARTGAPPGRYELAVGWALVRARGDAKGYERLYVDDPRWALHGLGPVHGRGEHRAAAVQGRATLGVPLRQSLRLQARLRAWTDREGSITVELPGESLELRLRPGWHDYVLSPSQPWPAGLALVRLHVGGDAVAELAWLDVFVPGADPQARSAVANR